MTKKKQHIEKEEFLSEEMLVKYQKGELLPSEMRRVEGLLEKYPLYADALEGYGLLETEKIRSAVDFLKTDIQANIQKVKPTKTVFLRLPSMVRVAAAIAFLLVSSLGIYFFTKTNSTENKETAQQTIAATNEEIALSAPIKDESIVESKQEIAENTKSVVSAQKEVVNKQDLALKNKDSKATDSEADIPESNAKIGSLDTVSLAMSEPAKPIQAEVDGIITSAKTAPVAEERKIEAEALEDKLVKKERAKSKKMIESPSISTNAPTQDDSVKIGLKEQVLLFAKENNEVAKGKLFLTFSTSKEGVAENIIIKESPCVACNDKIIQWLKEYKKLNKNELEKVIEIIF